VQCVTTSEMLGGPAVITMGMLVVSVYCRPNSEDGSTEYEYPDNVGERSVHGEHSLAPAITYNKVMQPLVFWEKVKKKPRGKHMKSSRLMKKMGADFQSSWMSVERPTPNDFHRSEQISLAGDQVAMLMEQVSDLDIETEIREMMGEEETEHEPTVSRAVGAFQQWLVKKSSCPVQFEWEDLGEFFWPRYVRQGECQQGGLGMSHHHRTSCSWPRGMNCNPADAEVLQILRWHCRRRKTPDLLGLTTRQKIRKSYKCRWIKVPYPVTSSCKCD